jgi:hypothetical protein
MTRLTPTLLLVAVFAPGLSAAPAWAQLARTYVSAASGSDLNNCDRLTPCRTFQHAHDNTLAQGEITVLDAGGYGSVTINRAISIINDGVGEAGALVSGGATGITINAPATDAVSLRGLTIKGIGFGGGDGIQFNTGKSLTIANCVVRNLDGPQNVGYGILFVPTTESNLAVSNTVTTDNTQVGLLVEPFGTNIAVRAVINRVEARNNANGILGVGIFMTGTLDVTVVDSVAANNSDTGIGASSFQGAAKTNMMIVRSRAAYNKFGVASNNINSTLRMTESVVTGNATAVSVTSPGVVLTYGDNQINANAGGESVPPPLGKK